MNPKKRRHLAHILACIERTWLHCRSGNIASASELSQNITVCSAIERELYAITQCIKDIGWEVTEISKDIPWKEIAGMRDILAHHYMDVSVDILWDIITHELPPLEKAIRAYLSSYEI